MASLPSGRSRCCRFTMFISFPRSGRSHSYTNPWCLLSGKWYSRWQLGCRQAPCYDWVGSCFWTFLVTELWKHTCLLPCIYVSISWFSKAQGIIELNSPKFVFALSHIQQSQTLMWILPPSIICGKPMNKLFWESETTFLYILILLQFYDFTVSEHITVLFSFLIYSLFPE